MTRVDGSLSHDLEVRSQPVVAPDNLRLPSPCLIGPDALFNLSDPRQPALVATGGVNGELDVEVDLLGGVAGGSLHFFWIRSPPPALEPFASPDLLGVNRDIRIVGPHALVANAFVADTGNHVLRRIDPSGSVETLAGTGQPGYADGPGTVAQFLDPADLGLDRYGSLYVADGGNRRLRRVAWGAAALLTSQPQGTEVVPGATVTLTVAATGSAPLKFRWRKNGAFVEGAFESALTLPNAQPSDSGRYDALVWNHLGLAASHVADVIVRPPVVAPLGLARFGAASPSLITYTLQVSVQVKRSGCRTVSGCEKPAARQPAAATHRKAGTMNPGPRFMAAWGSPSSRSVGPGLLRESARTVVRSPRRSALDRTPPHRRSSR